MTAEILQLLTSGGSVGVVLVLLYFFKEYLNKLQADSRSQQTENQDRVDKIHADYRSEIRQIVDGFTGKLDKFGGIVENVTNRLDKLGAVIEDLSYEVNKQNDILAKTAPPPANKDS